MGPPRHSPTPVAPLQVLPWWLMANNPPPSAGEAGSTPESRGSPEEGSGNPLQYSCLGNPMDRGDWWATVHVQRTGRW